MAILDDTVLMPYDEYEALPEDEKWMAHETLPATQWFARETARLRHLLYIPVLPRPGHGTVEFYYRCSILQMESVLIAADEETVLGGQDDGVYVEADGGSESDESSSDTLDDDDAISDTELLDIERDADTPLQTPGLDKLAPVHNYLTWLLVEGAAPMETSPLIRASFIFWLSMQLLTLLFLATL